MTFIKNMPKLKPLIAIIGQTASGKTGLALELAKKFNGELTNADSRQIYREMDIATNKIGKEDLKKQNINGEICYLIEGIPIHILDILDPNQEFSLAEYKALAIETIQEIQGRDKLPIMVGGTGLYVDAVTENFQIPAASTTKKIREELEKKDAETLFNKLKELDPTAAGNIGEHNKRKLIRALEVCLISDKPFSLQKKKEAPLFDVLKIGITKDRKELYLDIDERVDQMIELGLVEETKKLQKKYSPELPAMSGIGYKEISDYLNGNSSLEEAIQKIKFRTHQYARRQTTWFKKDEKINWVKDQEEATELVKKFLI
jgi:tRNA dimethylallyltransferase